MKNKVFGIGGDQYHSSTVFGQADIMMPFQYNYNYPLYSYNFYPQQMQMQGMEGMMYNQQMPGYYRNMGFGNPMSHMRQ